MSEYKGLYPNLLLDKDWITAREAVMLVGRLTSSETAKCIIRNRSHATLVNVAAAKMFAVDGISENVPVAPLLWSPNYRDSYRENWESGDFEFCMKPKLLYRYFGVRFNRADIEAIVNDMAPNLSQEEATRQNGGRPMSKLWPDWVAELVNYVHQNGIPPGLGAEKSDALIAALEARLSERGLDAPSRPTVQPTISAVLRRLRSAEN